MRDLPDLAFDDLGEQQFKNIARPVRTYAVAFGASPRTALPATAPQPHSHKPSPAVLPFQKILISYRREDSQGITGRIFDRLVAHYGREAIFWDVDSVPLGVDFREYIADILDRSQIILVVVGDHWLGGSRNRLVEPADNVRIEVETALQKKVPVVPLLVGGAAMPNVEDLPDGVKGFAYRNGLHVDSGRDFDTHMTRLISEMDRILAAAAAHRREEERQR